MPQATPAHEAESNLTAAIMKLKEGKPNDRSAKDRDFSIVITEIEKARAILRDFLLEE